MDSTFKKVVFGFRASPSLKQVIQEAISKNKLEEERSDFIRKAVEERLERLGSSR